MEWGSIFTWLLSLLAELTTCYNIDTSKALVFTGPDHSYFGYSVALLNNSQGSWLLAGAPKASSQFIRGVNSPGALYKCPIHGSKPCAEVKLDDRGNGWERSNEVQFRSRKDYQWLGASIDVKPSYDSRIVVCAHKWSNTQFKSFHYLVNGMCFEVNEELDRKSMRRLYPLVGGTRQVRKSGLFIYGTGMTGFSAHYAQDGSLLLGAPGVNDWRGGIVSYKERVKTVGEDFSGADGYAGYSLSSGRMYGDKMLYYVTGAPRVNQTGEVYILNDNMEITSSILGRQTGENFGAAVLALDVNGDQLDDLIIGAPFHSYDRDEGKVYVFINRDLGVFFLAANNLEGPKIANANFGSAIANLADINLDGYPDIAIGAPFDGDGRGAIYIYNCDKEGLREKFSQRIAAKDVNTQLWGFGATFSRMHDIDGNSYGDFAVGSFASNKAVVLRGRPVINLGVQIKFSTDTIDLEKKQCELNGQPVTCFTVTVCFQFEGTSLPKSDIDISYNLTADTLGTTIDESKRLSFYQDGINQSILAKATVQKDAYSCHQHQAFAFASQDIITPVKFGVSFELSPRNTKKASGVLGPVLNIYRSKKVSKQILYLKNCGTDNICSSDLVLETRLEIPGKRDYLISGEDSYISHEIIVTNTGEPAYMTNVYVTYPPNLQFVRVSTVKGPRPTVCMTYDTEDPLQDQEAFNETLNEVPTSIVCDIGNPVRSMETIMFRVKIFVDSRNPAPDPLQIRTVVKTGSAEGNDSMSDNSAVNYLLIRMKAGLIVTGISSPEQMRLQRVDFKINNRQVLTKTLNHVYEVGNLGPSMLPHGTMFLSVLFDTRLRDLVRMEKLEVLDPSTGLVVADRCHVVQPVKMEYKVDRTVDKSGLSTGITDDSLDTYSKARTRRAFSMSTGRLHQLCEDLECISGQCTIQSLQPETSVHVRLVIQVQSNIFVEIQDTDLLKINSSVRFVERLDPMYIAAVSPDRYNKTITTTVYTDARRKTISLWALVASCGAGILAIAVFIILLWRTGFFRRKKKEDLARLIERSGGQTDNGQNNINEQDNMTIRLQQVNSGQDAPLTDSGDNEEPVLTRNSDIANGHSSRLLQT